MSTADPDVAEAVGDAGHVVAGVATVNGVRHRLA